MRWSHRGVVLLMVWMDISSFFNNVNVDAREQFFYFQKINPTRANGIRALHNNSRVTMFDGTGRRLAEEQVFTGDRQGSPDSNCESTGCTYQLCQAIQHWSVGFELHDDRIISPSLYCDDLEAAFRGLESTSNHSCRFTDTVITASL